MKTKTQNSEEQKNAFLSSEKFEAAKDNAYDWFCQLVAGSANPERVEANISLHVNDYVMTHCDELIDWEKDIVIDEVINLYE